MLTERSGHSTVDQASDRSHGLVFAAVFLIIGLWPLLEEPREVRLWAVGIAVALTILSFIRPRTLAPLSRVWHLIGLLLHRIVSPVLMAAIFFLVVTPVGLLKRLFEKDQLGLKPDPSLDTYWIKKEPTRPKPGSMSRQF